MFRPWFILAPYLLTSDVFLVCHNFLKFLKNYLINVRLDNFIERHSVIASTGLDQTCQLHSLLELTEEITSALDKKKSTIGVL